MLDLLKVQVWISFQKQRAGAAAGAAPQGQSFYVLLLQTNAARQRFWQPVTGSVEPGESILAAAVREVREETGLALRHEPRALGHPVGFISNRGAAVQEQAWSVRLHHPSGGGGECPLDSEGLPQVFLDGVEHEKYAWLLPEEALKRVFYPSNRAILELLIQHRPY